MVETFVSPTKAFCQAGRIALPSANHAMVLLSIFGRIDFSLSQMSLEHPSAEVSFGSYGSNARSARDKLGLELEQEQ